MSKTFKRYDTPDSDWSDPGSTLGIADRWTARNLCGLHLTAGHNARKPPDYKQFVVPESKQPWHVYALAPHPVVAEHWSMTEVAGGVADGVDAAKEAAERAARAWSPS
jgi:hypothetical protein